MLLTSNRKVTAASSKEEVLSFIKLLRPQSTGIELIRIGGDGDGGYLVPDDFEGIKFCFSPGVSEIATFEERLANDYSIYSYMADASVERPPVKNNFFNFEKKYLGTRNVGHFMRLETWLESKREKIENADLILQMDIEGAEYDVLIDTSCEILRRFRIIVIEFHNLHLISERSTLNLLRPIFEKISNDFVVTHLHPNNYKQAANIRGLSVPRALEVTFLRKDRIRDGNANSFSFPHPLDQPNQRGLPDVLLPKVWWNE